MADDPGKPGSPTPGPSQDAELAQVRRLADYEQTVAQVRQLTEVRFKLVALVPTLTAAAVALLSSSNVDGLTRAVLAAGGLGVAFGIVVRSTIRHQLGIALMSGALTCHPSGRWRLCRRFHSLTCIP